MTPHRQRTRRVRVGKLALGHGAPVVVQSMTTTSPRQVKATLAQIRKLANAGCELVRVAVPDEGAAQALSAVTAASSLPVVADIHFSAELAHLALAAGVAKVRINPGNLGAEKALEVGRDARDRGVAVRIGVNSGSVPEARRRGAKTPGALGKVMAELALEYAQGFEKIGHKALVLSVKSSDVLASLAAYRYLAQHTLWPLHLGITEAGSVLTGAVKSAAGLSPLLLEGIGDTLRVSLTGDPVQEIPVANQLLAVTGVRRRGVEVIACPTCGRTQGDLTAMLARVERELAFEMRPLTVAVMGCVVNGPGEARHADFGLAGAPDGRFLLFAKGKPLRKVAADKAVDALLAEIKK
ncbi:MAG: flavodoxin-dependent (E)-4-hydroxy-3-methylbut-2-enyl-diphosphate synthase [Candidatus Firestonebacteria bacterium]|nr:flavodoxin-dependent (E)-4-hydroxy-3-methylbut-2-enyl-diphosphate synthase [Candidatus Firestonebacteria bacterium]